MKYLCKVAINGETLTDETSESSYITSIFYNDVVSDKAMAFGSTGANRLTFSIINPNKTSYDGAIVEFWVKAEENNTISRIDEIIAEVGDEATLEAITESEIVLEDAEEDDGEGGEDIAEDELIVIEGEIDADDMSVYEFLDGSNPVEVDVVPTIEDEWIKLGTFIVYQQDTTSSSITLTCYDNFALMNTPFVPKVKTATATAHYSDLCNQLENSLGIIADKDHSMPSVDITWNVNTSFRDAIGIFAGLCGGYADFDEDGILTIEQFANSDLILLKEELLFNTSTSGGDITIDGLACNGLESGVPVLSFNNPYMTQSVLDDIYNDYKGIRLSGQNFGAMWTPQLKAGTFVRLMTEDEYRGYLKTKNYIEQFGETPEGVSILNDYGDIVQIAHLNLSFNGDAIATVNAALSTVTEQDNPSVQPVKDSIDGAKELAQNASAKADSANQRVDRFGDIVIDTAQHFYTDDVGAHVTSNAGINGKNLLLTNDGVRVMEGYNPLARFHGGGFEVYSTIGKSFFVEQTYEGEHVSEYTDGGFGSLAYKEFELKYVYGDIEEVALVVGSSYVPLELYHDYVYVTYVEDKYSDEEERVISIIHSTLCVWDNKGLNPSSIRIRGVTMPSVAVGVGAHPLIKKVDRDTNPLEATVFAIGNSYSDEMNYNCFEVLGDNCVRLNLVKGIDNNSIFFETDLYVMGRDDNRYSLVTDKLVTNEIERYDGDTIRISAEDIILDGYGYKEGETVNIWWQGAGFLTNASKEVTFTVPLPKPIKSGLKATVVSQTGLILRQNSKYTHGSASSTWIKPTYTTNVCASGIQFLTNNITNTTNAVNNAPIGVNFKAQIRFDKK